jgi:integrase
VNAAKIVKLNENSVFDQVEMFLNKKGYRSERTKVSYETDIKRFFKITRNKEIKHLTEHDVQITLDDFENFINTMYNRKHENGERYYNNKTINRNITVARGILEYLHGKKIIKDISYFKLIDYLPETKNPHGVLSVDEVYQMANWAGTEESHKKQIKHFIILFSLDTCARLSECLSLKWSYFEEKEDRVQVKMIGKGNKDFRPSISKEFYNNLLSIKSEESDSVFPISKDAITDMMERYREYFNIPKERRIVFHSIRKAGAMFQYRISGNDIMQAKKALNHSSVTTTQVYLDDTDYGLLGAVSSANNDMELYKKVSHEELIKALDNCNNDLKIILNMRIHESFQTK